MCAHLPRIAFDCYWINEFRKIELRYANIPAPFSSMNYEAHYAQRGDRFHNDQLGRASEHSLEVKFY